MDRKKPYTAILITWCFATIWRALTTHLAAPTPVESCSKSLSTRTQSAQRGHKQNVTALPAFVGITKQVDRSSKLRPTIMAS